MSKPPKETQSLTTKPLEIIPRFEHEMERMFEDLWRRPFMSMWKPEHLLPRGMVSVQPALDVYEDKGDVIVKAEVPGLSKADLDVNISGSTLTIKGEKKKEEEVKHENYYRCERSHGSFARTIELPAEVKADQAKATFKNGVLEIRFPMTEEARKKTMKIQIE